MKKRTEIFVLLLFLFVLPVSALAAEQETYSSGHFYYHAYPGYVSIAGYLGTETEVKIPSSLAGKPVSEIEDHAFDGCSSVKQITIPDTVTKIGEDAFTGAEALVKIISNTKDVSITAEEKVTIETEFNAAKGTGEVPAAAEFSGESTVRENAAEMGQADLGDGGYEESGSAEKKPTEERMQTEGMSQTEEYVQTENSVQKEERIQTKESIQTEESVQTEQSIQTEKTVQTEQNRNGQKSKNLELQSKTDYTAGWIFAAVCMVAVCTGVILYRRKK